MGVRLPAQRAWRGREKACIGPLYRRAGADAGPDRRQRIGGISQPPDAGAAAGTVVRGGAMARPGAGQGQLGSSIS